MADPVFVDNVTPLNAVNMNKLQTRDEKAVANGYPSLDATGKVPVAQLPPSAGGADLTYEGDYVPATSYQDGDVVVKDGVAFMAVGGPTTDVPDTAPWGQASVPVATPALLAVTSYVRATDGMAYTVSSTTLVDIDPTNLAVTFTAPASGRVLVRLTGCALVSTANDHIYSQLREGTTPVGPQTIHFQGTFLSTHTASLLVSGIAAGSHTYKWAWRMDANTGSMYGGPLHGPQVMEVWAA